MAITRFMLCLSLSLLFLAPASKGEEIDNCYTEEIKLAWDKSKDEMSELSPPVSPWLGLLSRQCIETLLVQFGDEFVIEVIYSPYPTIAYGNRPNTELVSLFRATVEEGGDHGYFASDPDFLPMLLNMRKEDPILSQDIEFIYDFVLTSQRGPVALAQAFDKNRFLKFLPIWQKADDRDFYLRECEKLGCIIEQEKEFSCYNRDFAHIKQAYAKRPEETLSLLDQCDYSGRELFFGIIPLRVYGIIDTRCSSSAQMNTIARRGFRAGLDCLEIISNFAKSDTITDLGRFLYLLKTTRDIDGNTSISKENFNYAKSYIPGLGRALERYRYRGKE